MREPIAKTIARRAAEGEFDMVALWSAALWVAALLYLLATFDPLH
ncbi:MAG TPA: hypothetical protein VE224_09035 [Pseudolabrys sp.]|nr:hypothetical protein [Pseudolabrys sp.]